MMWVQWIGAVLLGLSIALGPFPYLWPASAWGPLVTGAIGSVLLFAPWARRKFKIPAGAKLNDPHSIAGQLGGSPGEGHGSSPHEGAGHDT
jgi:hypothetical protein